jgi:phage protein D
MANIKPTFSLSVGSLRSTSESPVGGLRWLVSDRDMGFAADSLEIELTERSDVAIDNDVALELGYEDEKKKVFTGTVVELRPTLLGTRVRALGKMNALLKLRTAAVYEGQTVGQIVQDLLGKAGLTGETVSDGPTLPRFTIDQRCSGYRYAKDLAERLGYELYTDREGKVMFQALGAAKRADSAGGALGGAAAAAAGAAAALAGVGGSGYQYGKHLIRAGARRQAPAWSKVEVGGESPMSSLGDKSAHWLTASEDSNHGSAGEGDQTLLVIDPSARTKDLSDRFAAGYLNTFGRTAHQLTTTVFGQPGIELGDSVSVSDVPDALANGSGYVRAVRHRFGVDVGFLTDLRIVLEVS